MDGQTGDRNGLGNACSTRRNACGWGDRRLRSVSPSRVRCVLERTQLGPCGPVLTGLTNQERPPSQVTSRKFMPLRRHQNIAANGEASPGWIVQVTTATENAEQPVGRMRNPDAASFPIAQRARGDLEQIGALGLRQPKPETGL